ncbi:MAG: hypothetical protein AB1640_02505 [bacterium]
MNADAIVLGPETRTVLLAKLRMALFLFLLFLIHIAEAGLTFPFKGHETSTQNVLYGLVVTAPFNAVLLAFALAVWRDLSVRRREARKAEAPGREGKTAAR